jgi:ATP/ADP translocase
MSESSDAARKGVWAATGVALVMVGQVVVSRVVRDGFFLTHFEATALPFMMTTASLLSITFVLGSTRLLRNVAPARLLPVFFCVSAGLFAIEWALCGPYPRVAAVILYLHTMSVGSVVASGFWSVVNERFDPRAARRLMGRIGGAASAGGVIGGAAVWLVADAVDIPTMILALSVLNGGCALGALKIGEGEHAVGSRPNASEGEEPRSSLWDIFQETPYLRNIATLVILTAFAQAVYDYIFKAEAALRYDSSADLVSFFALFYLGISVASFVVQNLLARRSLERFGLALTAASLPGIGLITGGLALFFPGLASGIGMRGGTGVVENSLFRSSYELLYTPVLPKKKRPTKALIDVGGDKLGVALGGGAAFFVLGIFPSVANPILVCAGMIASVVGLVLMRRLHNGYVGSLAERLRVGTLDVSKVEVVDATMQIAVSEAQVRRRKEAATGNLEDVLVGGKGASGRTELIERMRPDALPRGPEPSAPRPRPYVAEPLRVLDAHEVDETLIAIADLRSSDPRRIKAGLVYACPLPRALVGHVIPLLARDDVADAAAAALRSVAPANTGTLLDSVLQSRTPLAARRRLCDLLGQLPTQRSVDGLVQLLVDDDFELRFRAAASLFEIRRGSTHVSIPQELLFEVARQEAMVSQRQWRSAKAMSDRLSNVAVMDSAQGRRVVQGMAFIFTLLLSVLEREPLQLAIRALSKHAGADRGTGLEYLENVLPGRLLLALRPLLDDNDLALDSVQFRSDILAELIGDAQCRPMDLAALRSHIDVRRTRVGGGSRGRSES